MVHALCSLDLVLAEGRELQVGQLIQFGTGQGVVVHPQGQQVGDAAQGGNVLQVVPGHVDEPKVDEAIQDANIGYFPK